MRVHDGEDFQILPLEINGELRSISVRIKESPRARSFRMWIAGKDLVNLTKPRSAALRDALAFAKANEAWLKKNIAAYREPLSLCAYLKKNPFIYADGNKLKVMLKESRTKAFFVEDGKNGEIVFAYAAETPDDSLEEIFREFAEIKIAKLAAEISDKTKIDFKRISVRDQASRWASRSSTGTMSFNWRMLLLPCELQEYIVCHELAHARFMDHSTAFWIYLNRLIPNAKKLDARLSKEGKEIFAVARAS